MKRVIFILFAVMFGGTLTAQNQFTIGDLTYEVLNGGNSVEVHDCDTSATSVDIPSTVTNNGTKYRVTSIVLRAFSNCSILTSVTIPNSVTYIGFSAFYGCSSLTTINVDSDNNNYSSIDGILYNHAQDTLIQCPGAKTSATIPNKVTTIGVYAFRDCSSLTSVTIPNSVTTIEENAFSGCTSLTSITIPNSVTYIGEYAFSHCSNLTAITIPIGERAFSLCSNLTSINIPNGITSIGYDAFSGCTSLTSINIPNSVVSIGYGAFSNCSSLTSVTIPNSVKSIRDWAFSGCSNLTAINVDSGNTHYSSIDGVLYNYAQDTLIRCPEAKSSVNIPNSVTYIRNNAFSHCNNLTSVSIPNSVKSIGEMAFSDCSNLTAINVDSGNTHYSSIDGILYNYAQDTLIRCPRAKSSVTIPNKVTYIRNNAFYACNNLTSVSIPNSVTHIGENAFSNCSNLTSVSIPNSVTHIGDWAFSGCISLTSITIPNSVKSIGERAFSPCSNLTAINVDPGNTHYSSIDGILYNYAQDTLIRCPEAKSSVTIPNKVTTIEREAFSDCSNLTSIIIPNSVTFIGCHAFSDCSSLTSIISLAYTPPVSAGCFFGIKSDCSIIIPCKSMTAYQTSDYWIYLFYTNNITGSYYTEISATINEGETYTEYGFNENKTGTYTRTVENSGDCDSTIVLHLSVNASL